MKKMVKRGMAKVVEADFSSVFEIISRRRNRALMAVNVELLMTYWEIGAFLSPRIHAGSWDAAVVGRLADYLKRQDPTLRGYGKSNLYSMAQVGLGGTDPSEYVAVNMSLRMAAEFKSGRRPGGPRLAALELFV